MAKEFDLGPVRGQPGAPGAQGPPGPAGPVGPAGPAPQITIGSVTTLPAGSDATVTRRDGSPDSAPVLDFGIPRGAGSGDMPAAVYDPQGRHQDIFAYSDRFAGRRAATLVVAAADSLDKGRADYVCDAVADQLTIQQALTALPDSGGRLLLLEGTYWLDAAGCPTVGNALCLLSVDKPHVAVCGMGPATRLCLADAALSSGQACRMLYLNAAACSVSALRLDGNSGRQAGGDIYGVYLGTAAEQARLDDMTAVNCSGAAVYDLADGCRLSGCRLGASGCGAVLAGSGSRALGNSIHDCATGLRLEGNRVEACHNQISGSTSCGLHASYASGGALLGNAVVSQPVGIRVTLSQNLLIANNTVRRAIGAHTIANNEYTVLLEGANDCAVIHNRLQGKGVHQDAESYDNLLSYTGAEWNFTA